MKEKRSILIQGIIIGVLSCILVFLSYNIFEQYTIWGNDKGSTVTTKSVQKKLKEVDRLIQEYYLNKVDEELVVNSMFDGVAKGLEDTYSVYYTKKEYKAITEETEGKYSGIGVVMQQEKDTNNIIVGKCYENSPADKAGIKALDIIKKINNQEITEMALSDIGALIRNDDSELVHLTIYRTSEEKTIDFEIKKEKVEVQMVEGKLLEDKIGYLSIAEFTQVTAQQLKESYEQLKSQGMEKLILDLRNNPGGLVSSVRDIADMFLDEDKMVVYTEDKNGNRLEYKSKDKEKIEIPLVVLVNEYSASASEIFAGVVKDYNLGTIVGKTTFGKGIVQKIFPLEDESALKLTISNYFTPNGNNIHKKGIAPDVEVEMDAKDISLMGNEAKDLQLKKAMEILKD